MKSIFLCMGIFSLITSYFGYGSANLDHISAIDTGHSIYDIKIKTLDNDKVIHLSDYKGKYLVVVNTASECGYTPQYKDLQEFYMRNKDSVVVLGCPSNQFGAQEPGSEAEIAGFCKKNYDVTFPLTEKIVVKDSSAQHPLYQWLTKKEKNGVGDFTVKWNFNKFVIDPQGKLIRYFGSKVKPTDSLFLASFRH